MNNQTKKIGGVLALMAMAFFAGMPFWNWLNARGVSAALQQRTKTLVEKNPQLQVAWEVATCDGTLTFAEAKLIFESVGEKIEAEE